MEGSLCTRLWPIQPTGRKCSLSCLSVRIGASWAAFECICDRFSQLAESVHSHLSLSRFIPLPTGGGHLHTTVAYSANWQNQFTLMSVCPPCLFVRIVASWAAFECICGRFSQLAESVHSHLSLSRFIPLHTGGGQPLHTTVAYSANWQIMLTLMSVCPHCCQLGSL